MPTKLYFEKYFDLQPVLYNTRKCYGLLNFRYRMNHDQVIDPIQQEETQDTQDTQDIEMVSCARAQSPRNSLVKFSWKGGVPPRWLVLLAPIALNLGFGMYPVVIKLFANQKQVTANPFVFTFYRAIGAFPVLFTTSFIVEGRIPIPSLRMGLTFLLIGFIGIFFVQFTYIAGVFIVPPGLASAIQPLNTVWTPLVAILLCTEPLPSICMLHTWTKFIGIIVATGGAIQLALAGLETDQDTGNGSSVHVNKQAIGYFCLFLDTMGSAVFLVLQKKMVIKKLNCYWKEYPLALTGYLYLFGSMFMGLFLLYYIFTGQTEVFFVPRQSLPALVYAVFITSAFCYFLITWSNKYLPSSVMSAFWPLQVVTSVTSAYLILGDTLTQLQLFSSVVVMSGLALVVYSNRIEERLSEGGSAIRLDRCFHRETH